MEIEIYTSKTALERIKSMTVPEALAWALEWHKSDFGHDCNAMLEAESAAFQYFGEKMLELFKTFPVAMEGFYPCLIVDHREGGAAKRGKP